MPVTKFLPLICLCLASLPTWAQFPPSPPAVLFGRVTDETGALIDDGSSEIVFFDGTSAMSPEITRVLLTQHPTRNESYRVEFSNPSAISLLGAKLQRGGQLLDLLVTPASPFNYDPVSGDLLRFDFIIGTDSDADGLPDAWEHTQAALAGLSQDLARLSPTGDFDHDGLTDLAELLVGTIATDFSSQSNLRLTGLASDGWLNLSFDVLVGRRYRVFRHNTPDYSTADLAPLALTSSRVNLPTSVTPSENGRLNLAVAPLAAPNSTFLRVVVD